MFEQRLRFIGVGRGGKGGAALTPEFSHLILQIFVQQAVVMRNTMSSLSNCFEKASQFSPTMNHPSYFVTTLVDVKRQW